MLNILELSKLKMDNLLTMKKIILNYFNGTVTMITTEVFREDHLVDTL